MRGLFAQMARITRGGRRSLTRRASIASLGGTP